MTEIKLPTNQQLKKQNTLKSLKGTSLKLLVVVVLLGVVGLFLKDLYNKREALTFAYTNPKQAVEAKESYTKELENAQTNYASNLSRSYITN